MQVQSLSGEDSLEEEMATHSRIFAWRIPVDRERSSAGNSPWGRKQWDKTDRACTLLSRTTAPPNPDG